MIHLIHVDLIHDTHMPHPLSHDRIHFLIWLNRLLEIGMGEDLVAWRDFVCSELKHNVSSMVLCLRSRLIAWLSLL